MKVRSASVAAAIAAIAHDVVPLAVQQQRVLEHLLEVDLLHVRVPRDVRALEGVVHGLRDREELVTAVDDLPLGFDAQAAQERHVRREELGHASAVGGGVDVEDPRAAKRLGQLDDPLDRIGAGDVLVVRQLLFQQRDAFEHVSIPRERSGTGCNLSRMNAKAVACPDKFRGSLGAAAAAAAMARGLRTAGFADVVEVPLADGGEGTLDALLAARGGSRRTARVTGPLGGSVVAEWARLSDGTAVVEMARASGLALVEGRRDPLRANTRGTGELIAAAARGGAARVIVCVGGSASTDGGLAAVEALGWSLAGLDVVVACDVGTRFTEAGEVYGPQKGASAAQVALLTRRLEQLAGVYRQRTGVDVTELEGGGAAGGLAGGLAAIGARLEPGFEVVAQAAGLDAAFDGAELVVTGEGKLDVTSFEGKVVGGVLEWAADAGVAHRAAIVGQATDAAREEASVLGDVQVLALTDRVWQAGEAFARAAVLVEEAAVEAGRRALGRPEE